MKKKVAIIFTGGTISMKVDKRLAAAIPAMSSSEIMSMVTNIDKVADIEVINYGKYPSPHITPTHMKEVSNLIKDLVVRPDIDGVVVTHGTDSLEETAFYIDLNVDTPKPIVLVAAMRNSSELGYDGPSNISSAICTAISEQSRGKGVLVVLNNEVNSAGEATKTHTMSLDTFKSPEFGPLGIVDNDEVIYYRNMTKHHHIETDTFCNEVHLVKTVAGMDSDILDFYLSKGAKGVVILCGCTSTTTPAIAPETAWTQALELEQQGRTGEALELMREVIESGSYDEGRAYYFGRVFVAHASLSEVEAFYESYLQRDPEPQSSHFFWANALARHGRADLAERHLETALEIDPAHEMSHMGLAEIAAKQGRTQEAIEHLRTAVAIHPEFALAHARLAEMLEAVGQHDEAADHRDLASRSNPNTTRRFYYWGRFLLQEGRVEAAIAELEQAVQVDAEDEQARALLKQARQRLEP